MYTSSRGYQLADADCDRLRSAISRAQRGYVDGFMESIDWKVINDTARALGLDRTDTAEAVIATIERSQKLGHIDDCDGWIYAAYLSRLQH